MRTPLEIRNDALDCLRQAERAEARRQKAVLLILAQGWASLAEQMERSGLAPANDRRPCAADSDAGDGRSAAHGPSPELQSAGAN